MLELKTKKQLADEAHKLAKSYSLVRYHNTTYMPVDYETRDPVAALPADRCMWLPLDRMKIRRLAASQFDTLFASDGELSSFDFMVAQNATHNDSRVTRLLVRTKQGLKHLSESGELEDPSGDFIPNTLTPMLNENEEDKARIFSVVEGWVDSEEEAHSLLTHLATALAPGWSAVKYVLLLGEGRNGKSLLMKMLQALFGRENVSTVTRQHIAEQSPVVTELNGKLLNLVFDGMAVYLKDSGTEKTLIAGEPVPIRKLYESTPTLVQTTALFVEGLNREPKSSDKSSALQKRLVRFLFPNVYPLNHAFERLMLQEHMLGAFLALLIDHYVLEEEVAERLAPTAKAIDLQLEHMFANSIGLQYLKYLEENDPLATDGLLNTPIRDLVQGFQSWRIKENDLGTWAEPDVVELFKPLLETKRQTARTPVGPRKVRVITSLKPEAKAFIASLKGTENEEHEEEAGSTEDALHDLLEEAERGSGSTEVG